MTTQSPRPSAPCHPWPVGMRLRFKHDAVMRVRCYEYLRGTPVLVLSPLTYIAESNDWRQQIAAFGARWPAVQVGWARPEQLETIPDEPASTSQGSESVDLRVNKACPHQPAEKVVE